MPPAIGRQRQAAIIVSLLRIATSSWECFGRSSAHPRRSGFRHRRGDRPVRRGRMAAMLYFSSRPVDPYKIDLRQHRKLRAFKTGPIRGLDRGFANVDELRQVLLRDLTTQVRRSSGPPVDRAGRSSRRSDLQTHRLHKLTSSHRRSSTSTEATFLGRRSDLRRQHRTRGPGEVGPNGGRIGYTRNGDRWSGCRMRVTR